MLGSIGAAISPIDRFRWGLNFYRSIIAFQMTIEGSVLQPNQWRLYLMCFGLASDGLWMDFRSALNRFGYALNWNVPFVWLNSWSAVVFTVQKGVTLLLLFGAINLSMIWHSTHLPIHCCSQCLQCCVTSASLLDIICNRSYVEIKCVFIFLSDIEIQTRNLFNTILRYTQYNSVFCVLSISSSERVEELKVKQILPGFCWHHFI